MNRQEMVNFLVESTCYLQGIENEVPIREWASLMSDEQLILECEWVDYLLDK